MNIVKVIIVVAIIAIGFFAYKRARGMFKNTRKSFEAASSDKPTIEQK